jgi:FG-GAP-like repeat/PASTA domain
MRARRRAHCCFAVVAGLVGVFGALGCGGEAARPNAACREDTPNAQTANRSHAVPGSGASGSGPSFGRPATYQTERDPESVAIGDLDGDGGPDIVTASTARYHGEDVVPLHTVSVLFNRGDGTFEGRKDYPAGQGPDNVAIGDLNCDGKADIVSTTSRKSVSVLLNLGDRSFQPGGEFETGREPTAIAIADLDGKGAPDLAVANLSGRLKGDHRSDYESGTVSVLANRGDGSFESRDDYATGVSPMSLAVADLNTDGKPDLATASSEGESSVLLNRGDGSFEYGRNYDSTTGPSWVSAADLNGDSNQDLTVATNDWSDEVEEDGVTLQPAYVYTFANRSDGTFRKPHTFLETYGYAEGIYGLAVNDLNGDGRPDLTAVRDQSNYENEFLSLLFNSGDGRFRARLDYPVGPRDTAGDQDVPLAIGDLNGDRRPDLVRADASTHAVTVVLSTPGRCNVQDVSGETVSVASGYEGLNLKAAERTLAAAHCRVGTIRWAHSDFPEPKGQVIAQKPTFGAVRPAGAKVDLVLSLGPRR